MNAVQIEISKMDIEDILKAISSHKIDAKDMWALLQRNFGKEYFDIVLDDLYGIFSDKGLSSLSYIESKLK